MVLTWSHSSSARWRWAPELPPLLLPAGTQGSGVCVCVWCVCALTRVHVSVPCLCRHTHSLSHTQLHRKGQEEGTKPRAPGPTAHGGSKGRMCLKKKINPPAPFSETEEERKWRRPCSNYCDNYYQLLLQLTEQKKKGKVRKSFQHLPYIT